MKQVNRSMEVMTHDGNVQNVDNDFFSENFEEDENISIPFHSVIWAKKTTTYDEEEIEDAFCSDIPLPETNDCWDDGNAPVITGANNVTIKQGVGINLTHDVYAHYKGHEIEYTVSPETIDECSVGEHTVTYTAEADGNTTTVERKVTIVAISDPVIHGLTSLEVDVNQEFDPLDGVYAVDGNGNHIEVTYEQPQPTFSFVGGAESITIPAGDTIAIISTPTITGTLPTASTQVRLQVTNLVVDGASMGNIDETKTMYVSGGALYQVPLIDNRATLSYLLTTGEENYELYTEGDEVIEVSWDSYTITEA